MRPFPAYAGMKNPETRVFVWNAVEGAVCGPFLLSRGGGEAAWAAALCVKG